MLWQNEDSRNSESLKLKREDEDEEKVLVNEWKISCEFEKLGMLVDEYKWWNERIWWWWIMYW